MTYTDQAPKTANLVFRPSGPFSLEPLRTMACGFLRGTRQCGAGGAVRIAFPEDQTFRPIGVELREQDGELHAQVRGAEGPQSLERVRRQLARTLGLDGDGWPFAHLLAADPALAPIARRRPGFRPVVAYSPYVMAGMSVLSQRLSIAQAAKIQMRIAEEQGDVVEVGGQRLASFPRPESLLAYDEFPGVSSEKWRRLRIVARAAQGGVLCADALSALPYEQAKQRLLALHGIGPWTASAILIRGCGLTDELPIEEPRLLSAIGQVYGLGRAATVTEALCIAESWRPFRTWVSVLLVSEDFARAQPATRNRPRARAASRNASAIILSGSAKMTRSSGGRNSSR